MGAPRRGSRDAAQLDEHLDELASLADTAGAEVVGRLSQRLEAPAPNYYIGAGKVEELRALAQSTDASLVVFDEELSPAQGKNLEAALERRVMDRAELILDIFATRARSKEARMQVELAQLQYLLPRLARMWVHLSRIRGGIGLRGPGETQLETDRRMIRRKISTLKKKLEHVAQHRETIRRGRHDVPTAVLVGYTNAGKSSLLRALTGADTLVENRLFATLDTMARETELDSAYPAHRAPRTVDSALDPAHRAPRTVDSALDPAHRAPRTVDSALDPAHRAPRTVDSALDPAHRAPPTANRAPHPQARVRLVDTVGFIRKLPHNLVASFRATLEEVARADVLLHVIDASHPDWEDQAEIVDRTLAEIRPVIEMNGNGDGNGTHAPPAAIPVIHVFNKMDVVAEPAAFRARVSDQYAPAAFVSAEQRDLSELVEALKKVE